MQRRHLRREYVSFRHIGNQNPTKAGIPLCHHGTYSLLRFLHALQKASTHLFPTPSPPLSPLLQFVLIFCLSPILNIVSYLSPPPRSFAVSHLHIKYLLLVLLGSAVGIGYIVRHKLNNFALSVLPKTFTLLLFIAVRFSYILYQYTNNTPASIETGALLLSYQFP